MQMAAESFAPFAPAVFSKRTENGPCLTGAEIRKTPQRTEEIHSAFASAILFLLIPAVETKQISPKRKEIQGTCDIKA